MTTRTASKLVLSAGLAAALAAPATAHDEDWRKLADVLAPVYGPIYRIGTDTQSTGDKNGGLLRSTTSPASVFQSSGVQLLSQIPLNNFAGSQGAGNDCWGYTSPSGREYAIMGLESGYGFVEITDPANPQILTTISGPSSTWHDVKVIGSYAYGVSEGGSGVQVMDLANIDSGVVTLVRNQFSGGHSTTHNIVSNEDRGTLFLVGANIGNGGLIPLDLSDPTRPTVNGGWTSFYVHDAQVVTWQSGPFAGREIAFCASGLNGGFTQTGLRVVDITNPTAPQLLSTRLYSTPSYSHQVWLSEDQTTLYLNDELDEQNGLVNKTATRVFDVTDLTNPVELPGFTSGSSAIDHNLYVNDGVMYQANYRSGLRIFDVSDTRNPRQIGFFDTFPTDDYANFNGAWSVYPFFESGTVILSDIERGLFVFDVDSALTPKLFVDPAPGQTELPKELDAEGQTLEFPITMTRGTLNPATLTMVIQTASGTVEVPGSVSPDGTTASFSVPPLDCGDATYTFEAEDSDGTLARFPFLDPDPQKNAITTSIIGELSTVFADSFQTNQGWTVSGSVTDGQWTRGIPVTPFPRGEPAADADGTGFAFLTDNVQGNSDVDGGTTFVTSPSIAIEGLAYVTYAYWLGDIPTGAVANDAVEASYSTDGGLSWTPARRHDTSDVVWRRDGYVVDVPAGSNLRIRFSASDLDPQGVVEAGIDDVRVSSIVCPAIPAVGCNASDSAEPFGILNSSDVNAFVSAFLNQAPSADLAAPTGIFNSSDINAFVAAFLAGCP